MVLLPLDYLNGILAIGAIVIAGLIGVHILSKFFTFKRQEFLFIGLLAFLITEPWWPAASSFIVALFNAGEGLPPEIYFIIGNVLIPVAIGIWLIAFTDLMQMGNKGKKIILTGAIIYGLIFEFLFFHLLFVDPTYIGELNGPIDVEYTGFVMAYLFSIVGIIWITGVIFGKQSLKSENPEIKLRGKLIILA
ncbi:MAG: hypothetical protein EU548_07960, partial [Promethearchaeota archaeon]